MQITLDFQNGKPDVAVGAMRYGFVRQRSADDGKIRVFGAWFLNEYPLTYEYGPCPDCPYPDGDKDCHGVDGEGCPTTGWCEEHFDPDYDRSYQKLNGEVLGFAWQPEPEIE